jgi:hypothetical protein
MSLPELTFNLWYAELQRIAALTKNTWVISLDPEDHRAAYEDGVTPQEELDCQLEYAF